MADAPDDGIETFAWQCGSAVIKLAWREGNWNEAIRLAGKALDELPTREVSLRWRIQGWLADSLWHQGDVAAARKHWHEVLRNQPAVFRHLGLSLLGLRERRQ